MAFRTAPVLERRSRLRFGEFVLTIGSAPVVTGVPLRGGISAFGLRAGPQMSLTENATLKQWSIPMNANEPVRLGAHVTWAHVSARLSGLLCDLVDRDASVLPVSDAERDLLIGLCREWRALRQPRWYRDACRRIGLKYQSENMSWVYDMEAFRPDVVADARQEAVSNGQVSGGRFA